MKQNFDTDNYILVPGFAITELKLKGNELLCWSLIYGFSQDADTEFYGSLSYVASALNVTKANAKGILDRLIEKGMLAKNEVFVSGVKFCHYKALRPVIDSVTVLSKNDNGGIVSVTGGGIDSVTNNIKKDNITYKKKGTTENLCLFADSRYNDLDLFSKEFDKEEFADIDIAYYFYAVSDWSAQGGKKKRDWIATARNFIRGDMEKNKVHRKQQSALGGMFDYINSLQ